MITIIIQAKPYLAAYRLILKFRKLQTAMTALQNYNIKQKQPFLHEIYNQKHYLYFQFNTHAPIVDIL